MPSEYTRDLYNKLWDNINNKDARVWTFLSFFGATIGLFFSARVSDEIRALGLPILVLLNYWAINLVIIAEWWSARNRVMIGEIERQEKELYQFVPDYYRDPAFSSDASPISYFVLIAIMFVIMVMSVNFVLFFETDGVEKTYEGIIDKNLSTLFSENGYWISNALSAIYIWLGGVIVLSREKTIDDFFKLIRHFENRTEKLASEPKVTRPSSDWSRKTLKDIAPAWKKARAENSWRWQFCFVVLLYMILTEFRGSEHLSEEWSLKFALVIPALLLILADWQFSYKEWPPVRDELPNPPKNQVFWFSIIIIAVSGFVDA